MAWHDMAMVSGIAGPLVRIEESKSGTNLERAYFPHYFTVRTRTPFIKKLREPPTSSSLLLPLNVGGDNTRRRWEKRVGDVV